MNPPISLTPWTEPPFYILDIQTCLHKVRINLKRCEFLIRVYGIWQTLQDYHWGFRILHEKDLLVLYEAWDPVKKNNFFPEEFHMKIPRVGHTSRFSGTDLRPIVSCNPNNSSMARYHLRLDKGKRSRNICTI